MFRMDALYEDIRRERNLWGVNIEKNEERTMFQILRQQEELKENYWRNEEVQELISWKNTNTEDNEEEND